MKILHTADWHMNDTLGPVDRSDDIVAALRQIADYLEQEQVDVMLVAGDIIERGRLDGMKEALHQIHDIFLPFLDRGGTIMAIAGNHDSIPFFEATRDALELGGTGRSGLRSRKAGIRETDPSGRLYMLPRADVLRVADKEGTIVQFVLMPYPTSLYLQGTSVEYRNTEEKHRLIQRRFTDTLHELERRLDPHLPSVLMSHIHVRGVRVHERYKLTEAEDIIFEPSDIPAHFEYAAYGHIHKPQPALPNAAHIRYAGSIERLDAGDVDDEKSVVLVEIGPQGRQGGPRVLPLVTTPIYRIEIRDAAVEIPRLAEEYHDADRALVHYTLYYRPGEQYPEELCRQIETIFPRCYGHSVQKLGDTSETPTSFAAQHIHDVAGTVREYLETQLAAGDEREAVLALVNQLLAEEVAR